MPEVAPARSAFLNRGSFQWQIAVFCRNEEHRIAGCLKSISAAIGSRSARITLIVNGSTDRSEKNAIEVRREIAAPVEIFRIGYADKSHAINSVFYDRQIRLDAEAYFFVDGYVTIGTHALTAMADSLGHNSLAVAASGVACNGRTMSRNNQLQPADGGVLRGAFYALRPAFIQRIVEQRIRLPIGLYRGDGLLNSMAAHDLDSLGKPWLDGRILTVPDATFEIDSLSIFRLQDLRRQFQRKVRQMRGKLESEAVKKVIYSRGYAALPSSADDLIGEFLAANPLPRVPLADRPFMSLALRQLRTASTPDESSLRAIRVSESNYEAVA
jgi:hypothetical protein